MKILSSLLLAIGLVSADQAYDIAKKADQLQKGFKDETFKSTMELIDAKGRVVERKMVTMTIEREGSEDYSIIQFLNPADVRGTGLLTHQDPKGDDKQWLYLPELRRVKKISSSNKSGSFMGSEFTYEDISGNALDKWTYKLLKEDKLEGKDAWIIERTPTYKGSGYSKTKTWFLKEDNLGYRTEFFDRKGALLKVQTISSYTKSGNSFRWDSITIENLQTKKKSVLKVTERMTGNGLKEKDFNKRSLKRPIKF